MDSHRLHVLGELAATVESRKGAPAETSYTAKLLSQGVQSCAKKLGEEAVELALAAVTADRKHVAAEAADVMYHIMVLLAACGVPLSAVMTELERRQGTSGIAEKASRPKD